MSKLRSLLQTIFKSFSPNNYDELIDERSVPGCVNYYIALVFVLFVLMGVLFIPSMMVFPSYLQEEFSKFDTLKMNIEYDQTEPIIITENYPVVIIDTVTNRTRMEDEFLLITEDAVYYKLLPFSKGKVIAKSGDVLEHSAGLSELVTIIVIMTVPTVLTLAFLYFAVKFFVLIMLMAFLGFVLARIIRFGVDFDHTFKLAVYSATPMVVLSLITKPFIPNLFYVEYIIFLIYFFLGAIKLGDFEEVKRPSKKDED